MPGPSKWKLCIRLVAYYCSIHRHYDSTVSMGHMGHHRLCPWYRFPCVSWMCILCSISRFLRVVVGRAFSFRVSHFLASKLAYVRYKCLYGLQIKIYTDVMKSGLYCPNGWRGSSVAAGTGFIDLLSQSLYSYLWASYAVVIWDLWLERNLPYIRN